MQWQLSPSVLAEAGTALGFLIVAIYFPWRDLNPRASRIGSALLMIAALWILTHSLEIGTPVASYKAYLMGLQLIWGLIAMALWLMYIIQYSTPGKWQSRHIYTLFGIMPLLAIVALATNHIYGLMWTAPGLDVNNPYLPLEPAYGLFYWVCMIYIGALVACGILLILKKVVQQRNFRSWEPWVLILVAFLPVLAAFVEVAGLTQPANLTIGITPFFSGIAIVILVWSLPRFHLQKIIPVARDFVFQRIGDCVIVLNMQNRVVDLNPAAERLAGCTSSEALGLPVEQIWPDWPSQLVPSEPASTVYEELVLTRGGEKRTYDIYIHTISDQNNRLLNKVAMMVNATERKQARSVLKESEQRYRTLFESAVEGILIADIGTKKFLHANPAICAMLGYSQEELTKMSVTDIHPRTSLERIFAEFDAQARGDNILSSGLPCLKKDGAVFYADINTTKAIIDGRECNIGFFTDITERKRAEQELMESKALIEAVVENVPLMIFLKEAADLRFVIFNRAGEDLLGYDRKDLLGKNNLDLFPPEQASHFMAKDREVLDGKAGMLDIPEEPIQTARKGQRLLHTRKVCIRGADGVTKYLLGISEDITERKKAEAENMHLREKAEISSRLAAVGEMAAGIAHEINNPLTGVIGFSELLLNNQDLTPDVRDQVKVIAEGGKRVKDIVKRLLTFARQNKPVKTSTSINELIETTLDLRSYVLRTANIEVVKQLDPDLPWQVVDPGQMQQVFLNMIVNAEYAMKKAHGRGTLTITTEKKDDRVLISFRDDGTGINPKTKAKLFNPFFTTKEVNEGTGLGLSLSRSIILDHGGTIEVESELGQGANFIITLPIALSVEEPQAKTGATAALLSEKTKTARILVVDDEEGIRKLVSAILTRYGHTVDATGDTADALIKLASASYDVVVMDIRMPGMSGMELYQQITQKYPDMAGKFIFITGDTSDAHTRAFLEANNLPYITKPFDRDTLMKKVNGILQRLCPG